MKVTMKDGNTQEMDVTQCHGYVAEELSLNALDVLKLSDMPIRQLRPLLFQLSARVYRIGGRPWPYPGTLAAKDS